jgi:biopolymer transport protein TolR
MAINSSSGGSYSRRRSRRRHQPMSEINVTPFVDVMLVLLIIFMVAAPLLTVGVPVELPKTSANELQGDKEPLTITVNTDGKVFLQETEIDITEIVAKLRAIAKGGYNERIYIRGDAQVNYGKVMQVMGTISAAGFNSIGLVTQREEKEP